MNYVRNRDVSIPFTKLGNQVLYIPYSTHPQVFRWVIQNYLLASTKLRNEAKTKLISSSVVSRPSEKRTRELASLSLLPIAERTCEGFSEPAEQAEPAEAQIPSKSRAAS
jgi:hypothetical protein